MQDTAKASLSWLKYSEMSENESVHGEDLPLYPATRNVFLLTTVFIKCVSDFLVNINSHYTYFLLSD
jgi:hypothetical protein